jgi:thiamine pyrophosphokinase
MKPYTLIIAHGTLPSITTVRSLVSGADRIVCADGGANVAVRFGIKPDAIVGDCDSLTARTRKRLPLAEVIYRPSQYATDLEKSLDFCLERRFRRVVIIGATGKRLDHTLSNMSIMRKYHDRLSIRCIDRYGEVFFVTGRVSFQAVTGQIISLVPIGKCSGITTTGLLYPLRNGRLEAGVREGQSNVATTSRIRISVNHGSLLVFKKFL